MRDAVIVSTARTPIGRAYRGAFNATPSPTLAAHAIRVAVERSGVEPSEIADCIIGAALPQGVQHTIGRAAALRAGLPITVPGMTLDRQCSSGLMAIATAAKQVIVDRMDVVVAGGVESISLVQTAQLRADPDNELLAMAPDIYMPMLQTAEVVAKRYGISRERQDAYALRSQQLTAQAQASGAFDDEIIPVTATMAVTDKASGATSTKQITLTKDEGIRPETTSDGLAALKPVIGGGVITAGNASQLSDGASACVVMEAKLAISRGLQPLGRYVGMAVCRHRARRDGDRPSFCGAHVAQALRSRHARHWPLGAERGLRGAGTLLPGQARHSGGQAQRQWRSHLNWSPLWNVRGAHRRSCTAGRQEARREACRGDDVHRRRHGRRCSI